MDNNTGGAAFPVSGTNARHNEGMTLRDWFAGQAAAHMLGGAVASRSTVTPDQAPQFAQAAYMMADAMIAERCK